MKFVTSSRIRKKFLPYIYGLLTRDQKYNEVITRIFCSGNDCYLEPPAHIKEMSPEFVISVLTGSYVQKGDTDNWYEPLVHTCTGYRNSDLSENPYYKNVKLSECDYGDFKIVKVSDMKFELIQDGIPVVMNVDGFDAVVPRIGYWLEEPEPYYILRDKEDTTWMSITFTEINSMKPCIDEAHGNVLVIGCGLGYFAYMAALKENVKSVVIVDNNQSVINLFREVILPQFGDAKDKICIVEADAFEYMEAVRQNEYDFCFVDIWSSLRDSYSYYMMKKQCGNEYRGITMSYWIEDAFIERVFSNIRSLIMSTFVKEEKYSDMYRFFDYVEDKLKNGGNNDLVIADNMLKDVVIRSMDDIDWYWKYENVKKMFLEHYDTFIEGVVDKPYGGVL